MQSAFGVLVVTMLSPEPSPVRIALLGVPDHVMRWMTGILHRILLMTGTRKLREFYLDDDESTESFLHTPLETNQLIVSHYPRESLCRFLNDRRIPTLVVIDSLERCTEQHVQAGYPNFYEGARAVTKSLSLLAGTAVINSRVMIHDGHLKLDAANFISHLSEALFRIPINNPAETFWELLRESGHSVQSAASAIFTPPGRENALTLDKHQKAQLGMITDGLMAVILKREATSVIWPVQFFSDADVQKAPAPLIKDMLGPARCLYYGPYLYLSKGRWQGEVEFGLSTEVLDTYLRIEISAGAVLANFVTRARKDGLFALPIEFEVEDARLALEIRIFIDRGEIEGRFGLAQVRLWPDLSVPVR